MIEKMIREYKKGSSEKLSKYFVAKEFDCPCTDCKLTVIDDKLIDMLDALREELNEPLIINSAYRCPSYQLELKHKGYETAKGVSQHELGRAADISCDRYNGADLSNIANRVGFKAIGQFKYGLHLDMRADKERFWVYK